MSQLLSREDEPTRLYRHFDSSGTLLYVGISLNAVYRLAQHRDASKWFEAITTVTIETFATRQEALDAERIAIAKERPRHNVAHNAKPDTTPQHRPLVAESRNEILRKLVTFRPAYTIQQLAEATGLKVSAIRGLVKSGQLDHTEVRFPNPRKKTGETVQIYITGWQVIEYLERAERSKRKAQASALQEQMLEAIRRAS